MELEALLLGHWLMLVELEGLLLLLVVKEGMERGSLLEVGLGNVVPQEGRRVRAIQVSDIVVCVCVCVVGVDWMKVDLPVVCVCVVICHVVATGVVHDDGTGLCGGVNELKEGVVVDGQVLVSLKVVLHSCGGVLNVHERCFFVVPRLLVVYERPCVCPFLSNLKLGDVVKSGTFLSASFGHNQRERCRGQVDSFFFSFLLFC